MVIVAVKTFSWHSIRPAELARNPWPETLVMLVTVAATVGTSNLAIGVLAGIVAMALIPAACAKAQATSETASPDQEK
jgi:SulP family sulfate permease